METRLDGPCGEGRITWTIETCAGLSTAETYLNGFESTSIC